MLGNGPMCNVLLKSSILVFNIGELPRLSGRQKERFSSAERLQNVTANVPFLTLTLMAVYRFTVVAWPMSADLVSEPAFFVRTRAP